VPILGRYVIQIWIGLITLCEDHLRGHNPRDKDNVLLKPAWAANKELDRMGVVGLG